MLRSDQDLNSYLFYNKKGPIKYEGDEIYIDCKPVNSSGSEDIMFDKTGETVTSDNTNKTKNPQNMTLLEILGIFLFFIVLFVAGTSLYRASKSKLTPGLPGTTMGVPGANLEANNKDLIYQIIAYITEKYNKKN